MLKADSMGDSPDPDRDPALSARVITGGLSAPVTRWMWGATSYGLMGPVTLSMLHFLALMLKSLLVAIMAEKQKIIFWLDSGAHFSVLPSSLGPWSIDTSYRLVQIWPAPRVLVYLASGLLLGRPLLLSPFPHSSWNSSDSAGMGFIISTKSSNSPPPGSYLCCPLLQKQIDLTV
jgi:hypothetical protein